MFLGPSISIITTIINVILRLVTISLIKKIRYNQHSQVTVEIMSTAFYSMFINTGILQLLSNADFRQTVLDFVPINNNYNDFVTDWYMVMGSSIQTTMVIASVMPYVTFLMAYVKYKAKIFKDKGWTTKNSMET